VSLCRASLCDHESIENNIEVLARENHFKLGIGTEMHEAGMVSFIKFNKKRVAIETAEIDNQNK
jgi:hypothetical protein